MTDYSELVKALRCETSNGGDCWEKKCQYLVCGSYAYCNSKRIMSDAAAAIEDLQAMLTEADKKQAYQHDYVCELVAEVEELKAQLPKRGKWIVREVDIPGEIHPVAFRCMCSMCRNEYVFPRIPQYCPDCGSMNTAKMEVRE